MSEGKGEEYMTSERQDVGKEGDIRQIMKSLSQRRRTQQTAQPAVTTDDRPASDLTSEKPSSRSWTPPQALGKETPTPTLWLRYPPAKSIGQLSDPIRVALQRGRELRKLSMLLQAAGPLANGNQIRNALLRRASQPSHLRPIR